MIFKLNIDRECREEIIANVHQRTPLIDEIERMVTQDGTPDQITGYTEDEIVMLDIREIECFTVEDEKTYAVYKKGIESLNEQEWMAIRMIEKSSNQRMPMQEMMRMLPRSADFNSFKVAVNHLEELGLIRQDSEGSYYICDEEKV